MGFSITGETNADYVRDMKEASLVEEFFVVFHTSFSCALNELRLKPVLDSSLDSQELLKSSSTDVLEESVVRLVEVLAELILRAWSRRRGAGDVSATGRVECTNAN